MTILNRFSSLYATFIILAVVLGLKSEFSRTNIAGFKGQLVGDVNYDKVTNKIELSGESAGVSLQVDEVTSGQLLLKPVEIQIGQSFYSNVKDNQERVLAAVQFLQTSTNTTEIYLDLSESIDLIQADEISVFARDRAGRSESTVLPKENKIFIGTVSSETAAWLESKYWYCEFGECILVYDPEGTSMTFSNRKDESIPFYEFGIVLPFSPEVAPSIKYVNLGSTAR